MKRNIRTNKGRRSGKNFIGAWVDGREYAALEEAAKKNQRSLAGELRFRILEVIGK